MKIIRLQARPKTLNSALPNKVQAFETELTFDFHSPPHVILAIKLQNETIQANVISFEITYDENENYKIFTFVSKARCRKGWHVVRKKKRKNNETSKQCNPLRDLQF